MNEAINEYDLMIENCLPGQSIDCVIIGYQDFELKVLLFKWKEIPIYALPGGFIKKTESLDDAAKRILEERTGLSSIFQEQFYTFGALNRKETGLNKKQLKALKFSNSAVAKKWFDNRFFTTGYLSLVNINKTKVFPDMMSERCEWVSINKLPKLVYDHSEIIQKAVKHLSVQLNYLPFGKSLLNKKFTMPELHKLYEAVLNRTIDRANFQKKMLKLGIFKRHEKLLTGGSHKAPFLYSYDNKKYAELIEKGIGFV